MNNENNRQKPNCPLIGEEGNIFNLSGRNYKQLSATYEREQAEPENKIGELNEQLRASIQNDENAAKCTNHTRA